MMAWRIQPSLLLAFVARSPCLLAAVVWWVQVCRNDACRQRSLLYFSLIHIYYRIYFLMIHVYLYWVVGQDTLGVTAIWFFSAEDMVALNVLWEYVFFELRLFDFFRWRGVMQKDIEWPRIITVATFPPVFFINSCLVLYYLSNFTFSVLVECVLFELRLFDFFDRDMWREKVCDPKSLLSLLFLLYFSLFRLLHHIRSLTIPLLCRGSMYALSYSCLKIFDGEMWRESDTFIVTCEQILLELRLYERILNGTWLWSNAYVYLFLFMI